MSLAETSSVVRSAPLGAEQLAAHDQEARGVVRPVLDLIGEQLEAVDFGGRTAGNRRRAALIARAPRAFRIARYGDALGFGQLIVEPAAALRQGLAMRAHALDCGQAAHVAHQSDG